MHCGIACKPVLGYNSLQDIGAWRSPASALAWGVRGPGFESRRPDKNPLANCIYARGFYFRTNQLWVEEPEHIHPVFIFPGI